MSFKIETTVATTDMIKKLVGDNSPDEEEEPIAIPAPVVAAKVPPVKPVEVKKPANTTTR